MRRNDSLIGLQCNRTKYEKLKEVAFFQRRYVWQALEDAIDKYCAENKFNSMQKANNLNNMREELQNAG